MKKLLCLVLAVVMMLAMLVSCGDDKPAESQSVNESQPTVESQPDEKSEPASEEESEPASEPASKEESEPASEPAVDTGFDFLSTAAKVGIDTVVTGESVVVFTNGESVANGNCRWSTNILLSKTSVKNVYEVESVQAGDGSDPVITFGEGALFIAVHSDGVGQNAEGKAAAGRLLAGDKVVVEGIEDGFITYLYTGERPEAPVTPPETSDPDEEPTEFDYYPISTIEFESTVEGEVTESVRGGNKDNSCLIDQDTNADKATAFETKGNVLVCNTRCTEEGVYPEYSYILGLDKECDISAVSISFYVEYNSMIGLPKDNKVAITASSDGIDYSLVGDFEFEAVCENTTIGVQTVIIDLEQIVKAKYIKLTFAYSDSPFPEKIIWEWHGFTEFGVEVFDDVIGDEPENRQITVYKVGDTPVIDGKIGEFEYPLVAAWPEDTDMTARGDYVQNIEAYFYMGYDAEYLYYAIKTECDQPHSAYQNDSEKQWIFNAHHVMSLIIPDDPTNGKYPDETATWGDLYNGNYGYEWTMIYTSKKTSHHEANATHIGNHFMDIASKATIVCSHEDGWDYYEVAIPWSCMKNSQNTTALKGEEGTKFGFDFTIGLSDVNEIQAVVDNGGYDGITDADGNKVYYNNSLIFADCYNNDIDKCFKNVAVMTLGGEDPGLIVE